jgi:hypothetical protein
MKLIENWKQWHKFWSIRLTALGGFLLLFFDFAPGALAQVWAVLPADVQAAVPDSVVKYIGLALVFGGTVARVIKQGKLHAEKTD